MSFSVTDFLKRKKNGDKISMITAYDYSMAKLVEASSIDSILVGDSLGMTVLGYDNTLAVTVDDMLHHAKAVARGAKRPFIVVDMPFLSYHVNDEDAVRNAGRLLKESGAHAVKVEGGKNVLSRIQAIIAAQIPVMGHLGLTPQSVHAMGGFRVQGKTKDAAELLIEEAKLLEQAGCFAIVLECIPSELAALVTSSLHIPTIGIGSGGDCDGQVLVVQDMLGLFSDFTPKFVKMYADIGTSICEAFNQYDQEVKQSVFPTEAHCFHMSEEERKKLNL